MNLTTVRGAKIPHKKKFPVGRGESSGLGKQSGRGQKGQKARGGTSFRPYFEGGQMSIIRRIPKRGFNNAEFTTRYEIVNLGQLQEHFSDGETVDLAALRAEGLVRRALGVKLLGDGELKIKLTIKVDKASKSAVEKVQKAGGTVVLPPAPPPPGKRAPKAVRNAVPAPAAAAEKPKK